MVDCDRHGETQRGGQADDRRDGANEMLSLKFTVTLELDGAFFTRVLYKVLR